MKDAVLGLDGFEPDLLYMKTQAIKQHSLTHSDRDPQKASFVIPIVSVKDRHPPRSNPSLRNRHSIAELPSLSQIDYIRQPQPPSLLPTSTPYRWLPPLAHMPRQQPEFERHETHSQLMLSGRALSVTTSNVSWNDRALPFISSMRRTSFPNLTSVDHQHLDREWPGTRTPSEMYYNSHNSGSIRYDDINMHFEDDDYPLSSRYKVQHEQRRTSPTKSHGSRPYDKRGHR